MYVLRFCKKVWTQSVKLICRDNTTLTYTEMSLPKMPTPVRCELADNLSRCILFTCGVFGSLSESCQSSDNHNMLGAKILLFSETPKYL